MNKNWQSAKNTHTKQIELNMHATVCSKKNASSCLIVFIKLKTGFNSMEKKCHLWNHIANQQRKSRQNQHRYGKKDSNN